MTDKEKAIKALECNLNFAEVAGSFDCEQCGYECRKTMFLSVPVNLLADALVLLKRSFTPQEVYDTVIEHAQHDKRFKLGDKINYSFTDVVDILNIELMCKAGDM